MNDFGSCYSTEGGDWCVCHGILFEEPSPTPGAAHATYLGSMRRKVCTCMWRLHCKGQIEMAKEISDPAFVRRFKADMPDGELRHGKMVSSSWNDLWREGCVWSNSIALALWSTR